MFQLTTEFISVEALIVHYENAHKPLPPTEFISVGGMILHKLHVEANHIFHRNKFGGERNLRYGRLVHNQSSTEENSVGGILTV